MTRRAFYRIRRPRRLPVAGASSPSNQTPPRHMGDDAAMAPKITADSRRSLHYRKMDADGSILGLCVKIAAAVGRRYAFLSFVSLHARALCRRADSQRAYRLSGTPLQLDDGAMMPRATFKIFHVQHDGMPPARDGMPPRLEC